MKRLIILVGLYLGIVVFLATVSPREIDWRQTFDRNDAIPFGTRILHERMGDLFTIAEPIISFVPFYNLVETELPARSNYFAVNNRLDLDHLDTRTILEWLESGNTALLSAEMLPEPLLDSLGIDVRWEFTLENNPMEWMYHPDVTVRLRCCPDSAWTVPTRNDLRYFDVPQADSADVQALGAVRDSLVNFIAIRHGKGTLYLHTFPEVFTNFFMLDRNVRYYTAGVLSHLPADRNVIWDDYYQDSQRVMNNPFAILAQHASFQWAYWLLLGTGILFLLFNARRRQRMIPVIKPKRNASLDFIRTIGDLYFHQGNHADLVQKKLLYFKEYVRSHYHYTIRDFSNDSARTLARYAGRDEDRLLTTFDMLRSVGSAQIVSRDELRSVQRELDIFFQRKP